MMFDQMDEQALKRVIENAEDALANLKNLAEATKLSSKLFELKVGLEKASDILKKKPRVFNLLFKSDLPELIHNLKESLGNFLESADKFKHDD